MQSLRLNSTNLHEDPVFEDVLKNFVSSRLVEDDLDRIGDERMLKVVLLDQLMIEYLMNVQDSLLEDVARVELQHIRLASDREQQRSTLENNRQAIDDMREMTGKRTTQLQNHAGMRQQLASYQCPYCSKIFKNLHFLEKHLIRKELSSLRMEKDAERKIEEQRKKEEMEKAAQNFDQQQKLMDKEAEIKQIRDDVAALRAKLDMEHSEKGQLESKLIRVNQELTANLARMEQEIKDQKNQASNYRPQEPQHIVSHSNFQRPEYIQAVNNQIELRPEPREQIVNQRVPEMPVYESMQIQEDVARKVVNSVTTIELINKCIADNAAVGNMLVDEVKTDPRSEAPHAKVVEAIVNMLRENGMDASDPCRTQTGRMQTSDVIKMMAQRLKDVSLLRSESSVQPHPQEAGQKSKVGFNDGLFKIVPAKQQSVEMNQVAVDVSSPAHIQYQQQPSGLSKAFITIVPDIKMPASSIQQSSGNEKLELLHNLLQERGTLHLTDKDRKDAPIFAGKAVDSLLYNEEIDLDEFSSMPLEKQLEKFKEIQMRHRDGFSMSQGLIQNSHIGYTKFKNPMDRFDEIGKSQ